MRNSVGLRRLGLSGNTDLMFWMVIDMSAAKLRSLKPASECQRARVLALFRESSRRAERLRWIFTRQWSYYYFNIRVNGGKASGLPQKARATRATAMQSTAHGWESTGIAVGMGSKAISKSEIGNFRERVFESGTMRATTIGVSSSQFPSTVMPAGVSVQRSPDGWPGVDVLDCGSGQHTQSNQPASRER
jgi:hypothetical protein